MEVPELGDEAAAAGLHDNHCNTGSKLNLWPSLLSEARDQICILTDTSPIRSCRAMTGTPGNLLLNARLNQRFKILLLFSMNLLPPLPGFWGSNGRPTIPPTE